ncbi:hypothetical protein V6N13_049336 [Hibiscus sabdariffa]|uniref:Uncharacterized protein n=1 Tax=Hibiscus sabdariffa TaxID=183260 RepID=A0ABR2QXS0_9ROSI
MENNREARPVHVHVQFSRRRVSVVLLILSAMGVLFLLLSYLLSLSASFPTHSLALATADADLTRPSSTPINRDLYHSSDALIEQIRSLVHRHPDKLTVETIRAGNKGYKSEITVVTYCHSRKDNDDKSKFRILLIIHCLPEFWAAWTGAYYI